MTDASPIITAVSPNTEELRLAMTMTGGVSLAIWMGGVAREVDLLMQASKARRALQARDGTAAQVPDGTAAQDVSAPVSSAHTTTVDAERGLYSRLLELLDVVVEVDVLSGTSAGGINAALLAYARTRDGDLGGLRDLWLDLGNLLDLLRTPTDADVPSLLYGDRRMFANLVEKLPTLAPRLLPSPPPSTTLYITTTLLSGESSRFTDAMGTLVQNTDQHGLFTFTESDLATAGIENALALAARSTASFPGAFEPSFIPYAKGTKAAGEVPARPPMGDYANITRDHWVVDGGLLDNQPLDVVLERIFDRRARRLVRRVLLYVVPTAGPAPDLVAAEPGADPTKPYGLLESLLKDLSAATSQSISADLRAIIAHNDRISARGDLRTQLAAIGGRLAPQRLLTSSLLDDYCFREGKRQSRPLVTSMLKLLSTWPPQSPSSDPQHGVRGIPVGWQPQLAINGDGERDSRRAASTLLINRWLGAPGQREPALPSTLSELARFGQSAYDDGKSIVLELLSTGYRTCDDDADRSAFLSLIAQLHSPVDKPNRPDPDDLALAVCTAAVTAPAIDSGPSTLDGTVAALAARWSDLNSVTDAAWASLGTIVLAAAEPLARAAGRGTRASAGLQSYLRYLGLDSTAQPGRAGRADPADTEGTALRIFDLMVSEQALLPTDAGPFQPVELVQLSADTRSLLAPSNTTAASKLTGLQFHHFGAFYKRSWRANDWMWGRVDAAGWLVHVLLDPHRLQLITGRQPAGERVEWLLGELGSFGAQPLPDDGPGGSPSRGSVRAELAFLDSEDVDVDVPRGVPLTSLWLGSAWQSHVVADELPGLARVIAGEPGDEVDRSPAATRTWARQVLDPGSDLDALLMSCPVPRETFATDMGSPLMVRTVSKAAATTAAAASSVQQVPKVVQPVVTTARTITLAGYRVTGATGAQPRRLIVIGGVLLALGIALATQSSDLFGISGLITAGVGGYLLTFGAWQLSSRLLAALVAVTLTGAVASLAVPIIRRGLFGTSAKDNGVVGRHVYWLATDWWHPLLAVGVVLLVVVVLGALTSRARPRRRRPSAPTQ